MDPIIATAAGCWFTMKTVEVIKEKEDCLIDNGGRRLGCDRRLFTYNGYLPERRTAKERRSGEDRRKE